MELEVVARRRIGRGAARGDAVVEATVALGLGDEPTGARLILLPVDVHGVELNALMPWIADFAST